MRSVYPNQLYTAILQGDVACVSRALEANANAANQILYTRFVYDDEEGYKIGGYGNTIWQHVCNAIGDGKVNTADPNFREACACVGRSTRRATSPGQKWVLLHFALRAKWPDLVREALDSGVPLPDIVPGDEERWGREICDLIRGYGKEEEDVGECVICLDRPANMHTTCPCARPNMCVVCEQTLKEKKCPLCRALYRTTDEIKPH